MAVSTEKDTSSFLRDVLLVTISSVATAYLSVVIFGYDIEQKKYNLEIQKSIFENQFNLVSELSEKSGVLHNKAILYRQYDVVVSELKLPYEVVDVANKLEPLTVDKKDIMKTQTEFQSVLFKSKPFIPSNVFEAFIQYGREINEFIHVKDATKAKYEQASKSYAEGIELIREMYSKNAS
ncbi:hypothetical protein P0F20_003291 [Vibrio metschnikovii]|nr:hypothetical protein [Vibrio metschnikovii]